MKADPNALALFLIESLKELNKNLSALVGIAFLIFISLIAIILILLFK